MIRVRLEPGMGMVCNNVLHQRSGFVDDPLSPRLLYRARYLDRIAGDADGSPSTLAQTETSTACRAIAPAGVVPA